MARPTQRPGGSASGGRAGAGAEAGRRAEAAGIAPRRAARTAAGDGSTVPEKITIQEFRDLHRSGEPVIVLDVRTERSYRDDPNIGVGAIRMPPDDAVRLARERRLDQHATLVLYCA